LYADRGHSVGETLRALRVELGAAGSGVDTQLVVWFAYSAALLVVAVGRLLARPPDAWTRVFSAYAIALALAGAVAVLTPGRPFPHYLLLVVPGLLLASAGAVASPRAAVPALAMLPLLA